MSRLAAHPEGARSTGPTSGECTSITASRLRKRIAGVAPVGALTGGGIMATTMADNAADDTPSTTTTSTTDSRTPAPDAATAAPRGTVAESKSVRSDEHLLTGNETPTAPSGDKNHTPPTAPDGDQAHAAPSATSAG